LALLGLLACELHLGPLPHQDPNLPQPAAKPQGGPAQPDASGEVWVYTSLYENVIELLNPLLQEQLPHVKVQWYRAGSEKVITRLETELKAGSSPADLVLVSDPFWYHKLQQEGRLAQHLSLPMLALPREDVDPDARWATSRVSTMVIAYHPDLIAPDQVPPSFEALATEPMRNKLTLGDPLASGTNFTTLAFLSKRYGWTYYERLRQLGAVANGGNSAVLQRIEGKEFPVGVVLLENVLTSQAKGSPVRWLAPKDGVITIPGQVALLSASDNPAASRLVYDFLLSPKAQAAIVQGDMHSARPDVAPPDDTPTLQDLTQASGFQWSPAFVHEVQSQAPQIKARFDQVMHR
jgi:iron(III) transport system substrate-binding protein